MLIPRAPRRRISHLAVNFLMVAAMVAATRSKVNGQAVVLQRIDQGIAHVDGPAVAFGDIENDGDLDILVAGRTAVESPVVITHVYVGKGESLRPPPGGGFARWFRDFDERGNELQGVWLGAAAWFDPNRDGRLEFVISGASDEFPPFGARAAVYRDEGTGFSEIAVPSVGLLGGSIDVGDYNNDGVDDLLLTGSTGASYASLLYDGKALNQPSPIVLPGVGLGDGKFGDYDGDGDLDIFLIGDSDSGLAAYMLRNDGGTTFTPVQIDIEPLAFSAADWGDYDNDGDLDLVVAGARLSPLIAEGVTHVYRNDGNGVFTDIHAGIDGTYHGMVRWGDMNNDGYLDIVQIGGGGSVESERLGQIYVNQGDDHFQFVLNITGLLLSSGDLGDYDGDGDLDIIELGQGTAALFRNEHYVFPAPIPLPLGRPGPPSDLQAVVDGASAQLSWQPGTDDETPESGLSYNIRVGTAPGAFDVVSPMANPTNGKRRLSRMGNVQNNRSWTLHGLAPGTYFWSVQTIDTSFSGSDFAADGTFVIQ